MLHVDHRNFSAKMDVAFRIHGNAILKMTVEMVPMKEISVRKKLVLIINLLVLELDIVYRKVGFVMEMTIALINKTNKTAHQLPVCPVNLNVLICDSVYKKVISVMVFPIAMMVVMSWVVVSEIFFLRLH